MLVAKHSTDHCCGFTLFAFIGLDFEADLNTEGNKTEHACLLLHSQCNSVENYWFARLFEARSMKFQQIHLPTINPMLATVDASATVPSNNMCSKFYAWKPHFTILVTGGTTILPLKDIFRPALLHTWFEFLLGKAGKYRKHGCKQNVLWNGISARVQLWMRSWFHCHA